MGKVPNGGDLEKDAVFEVSMVGPKLWRMTMSDEGIGDPMPRASEAWHGEWRRRSRGSATRPSGSYQKGTVGMEASSDVLLVNVCVRRVDEAVATSIQELYQKELSGAARA